MLFEERVKNMRFDLMKDSRNLLVSALAGLAFVGLGATTACADSHKDDEKVKCFGVAKAGKNDCATGKTSCAGSAKMDRQEDAFVAIPKGICEKLAGAGVGMMKSGDEMK